MLWFYEMVFIAGERTALELGYMSISLTTLMAEFCGTQQQWLETLAVPAFCSCHCFHWTDAEGILLQLGKVG